MAKNYRILVYKTRYGHNGLYKPWMFSAVAEVPDGTKEPLPEIFLNEQGHYEQRPWAIFRHTSLEELAESLARVYPELLLVLIPTAGCLTDLKAVNDDWQCDGERCVSLSDRTLTQYGSVTDEELGELAASIQKYYYLRDDAIDPWGQPTKRPGTKSSVV